MKHAPLKNDTSLGQMLGILILLLGLLPLMVGVVAYALTRRKRSEGPDDPPPPPEPVTPEPIVPPGRRERDRAAIAPVYSRLPRRPKRVVR